MGTARTSPRVVRERRAQGISSNRGKVKRHFPKAHRNDRHLEAVARDAKAWEPSSNLEEAVERLLAVRPPPNNLREEVSQELWVRLLGGETEQAIRDSLSVVIKDAKDLEWGGGRLSLDSPLAESLPDGMTMGEMVDTEGVYHRSRPRVTAKKPMARCDCGGRRSENAVRCLECVRAEREEVAAVREQIRIVRRETLSVRRAGRLAVLRARYEAAKQEREAVEEWKEVYLSGRSARYRGGPLARARADADPNHNRTGVPHTLETRVAMSLTRAAAWATEYGEQRRAKLHVSEKVCRKCGYEGPWENFAKNPNCYGGRDKICKPCMSKQTQEMKRRRKLRLMGTA